eukprot:1149801-Pelagomonas_calceolata.AAC.9
MPGCKADQEHQIRRSGTYPLPPYKQTHTSPYTNTNTCTHAHARTHARPLPPHQPCCVPAPDAAPSWTPLHLRPPAVHVLWLLGCPVQLSVAAAPHGAAPGLTAPTESEWVPKVLNNMEV